MQLSLFQWDFIAVGSGYHALSLLDFTLARTHFKWVLRAEANHPEARQGLQDTELWKGVFEDLPRLEQNAAIQYLWKQIADFPFSRNEHATTLRHALIRSLLDLFPAGEAGTSWYQPPDLCRGFLFLQLGEAAQAEHSLRPLLNNLPEKGRLHRYLGDALWQQGKEDAALASYLTALLLSPATIDAASILCPSIAALIHERGPAITPIAAYFAGILPLFEPPANIFGHEAQTYTLLRQAEIARRDGQHQEMITARRALKMLAPDIFVEYMEWLS
jgi:tetratricopeptide (TPR) repeat protein